MPRKYYNRKLGGKYDQIKMTSVRSGKIKTNSSGAIDVREVLDEVGIAPTTSTSANALIGEMDVNETLHIEIDTTTFMKDRNMHRPETKTYSRKKVYQIVNMCDENNTKTEEQRNNSIRNEEDLPSLIVESSSNPYFHEKIEGKRLMDISYFITQYDLIASHWKTCTGGKFYLWKELRRGMNSTLTFICNVCDKHATIHTDPDDQMNTSLVWGSLAIGIGHAQTEELMATMNVPTMTEKSFRKQEKKIGQVWECRLREEMENTIKIEKQKAIEKGHVENGYPFLTVIVDGGWCRRTYGHGFSSNSGVACIIGKETKKLIYLGVKNKFCMSCAKNLTAPHKCNINYRGSSSGMEQAIIVEGFNYVFEQYGTWIKYVIGDGDSSVYARLRERAPFGRFICKLECANHVTKCYSSKLHSLSKNPLFLIEGRRILKSKIIQLKSAVRGAIKQSRNNINQLRVDLKNGPIHVFGDHSNCRIDYCQKQSTQEVNHVNFLKRCGIMSEIEKYISMIVLKADRLVTNETSNLAENYMAIVAKFTGGKRCDFAKGSSYTHRCWGAGLSHTFGPSYLKEPWKTMTGCRPGRVTEKFLEKRKRKHSSNVSRRTSYNKNDSSKKKKQSTSDTEYGPNAAQPDVSENEMQQKTKDILISLKNELTGGNIERDTVGQIENPKWIEARRQRLTASNFGRVIKMRQTTSCHNIVKSILYPRSIFSAAVNYGRVNEKIAVEKYEARENVLVRPCGIFVRPDIPYLGASPDGLVGDGIVEVKCIPSIKEQPIKDAAKEGKICVELKDNCLQLKKNHNFYFQIQGQLIISNKFFCDLILYTTNDMEVLRIFPDVERWSTEMLPKLQQFYMNCMLPELADSRIQRGMQIRDPKYITTAQKK